MFLLFYGLKPTTVCNHSKPYKLRICSTIQRNLTISVKRKQYLIAIPFVCHIVKYVYQASATATSFCNRGGGGGGGGGGGNNIISRNSSLGPLPNVSQNRFLLGLRCNKFVFWEEKTTKRLMRQDGTKCDLSPFDNESVDIHCV